MATRSPSPPTSVCWLNAIHGDPLTAWRLAPAGDPVGERLILDFDGPVTADRLDLTQPINMFRNRWVQRVRLHFDDGGAPHDAELGAYV